MIDCSFFEKVCKKLLKMYVYFLCVVSKISDIKCTRVCNLTIVRWLKSLRSHGIKMVREFFFIFLVGKMFFFRAEIFLIFKKKEQCIRVMLVSMRLIRFFIVLLCIGICGMDGFHRIFLAAHRSPLCFS